MIYSLYTHIHFKYYLEHLTLPKFIFFMVLAKLPGIARENFKDFEKKFAYVTPWGQHGIPINF